MAPWADALYAMDRAWWDRYMAEVLTEFQGERVSQLDKLRHAIHVKMPAYGNSGAAAIALAAKWGARRVIMLGYDCAKSGGQVHWHGDHPAGLGNAGSMPKWPKQFQKLADDLRSVEIINCSRQTALGMFPRRPLEEVLL